MCLVKMIATLVSRRTLIVLGFVINDVAEKSISQLFTDALLLSFFERPVK